MTRSRLINFISVPVLYAWSFNFIIIIFTNFYISRDGTSTDPNSITFHLSFLKYSTEYTYQIWRHRGTTGRPRISLHCSQKEDHDWFRDRSRPADDLNDEEEQDHREY